MYTAILVCVHSSTVAIRQNSPSSNCLVEAVADSLPHQFCQFCQLCQFWSDLCSLDEASTRMVHMP